MNYAQRPLVRRLGLSLLLAVLLAENGCCNCRFEVPLCESAFVAVNDIVAEYVLSSGADVEQRICVNSDSPQVPDPMNLTLRIHYVDDGDNGVFCADTELNSSSVCVISLNLESIVSTTALIFKLSDYVEENGSFALNFTKDGALLARLLIYYAPTGLHSLNSSTVTAIAGESFTLSWLAFDVDALPNISAKDSETPFAISGLLSEGEPWAECLEPHSNDQHSSIDLERPQLIQYVSNSVNIEEAGTYTLSANQTLPSSVQVEVTQLPAPPRLSSSTNSTLYFELNSAATIYCDLIGTLRPPAWFLDNVPLSAEPPGLTIEDTGLTFSNIKVSHSGWYTCSAANQWGREEHDFLVIVGASAAIIIPPNPSVQFNMYMAQPGTAVVLPCTTEGIPSPDVEWFMNDTKIVMNNNFVTEPVSNALIINDYTAELAQFHCRASNTFGTVESMPVLVNTLPLNDSVPGSLLDAYYDIGTEESVNLTCSDSPGDQYLYTWRKNHLTMPGSPQGVQITVSGSIGGKASGHYCCQIRSNGNVLLDTRCTVVNVRLPSTFRIEPTNTSVVVGRDVQLLCAAITDNGIDYPLLSWYKGSQALAETPTDPRFSYAQDAYGLSTLQIRNVNLHDQDVYTCAGDNFVGEVSVTADLRVVESSCVSSVLNSSGAEEDVEIIFSSWNFSSPEDGVTVANTSDVNGEKVFKLVYRANAMAPEISQTVPISESAEQARLTARMRTSNSTLQPVIKLTMANSKEAVNLTDVTLPFPSHLSWQWVASATINVSSEQASSAFLTVTMTFTGTGDLGSDVFFDDVCLEIIDRSDESVPPVSSSDLYLEFYLIMVCAVAVLVAILVVFLFVFFICCLQAGKRRKKRKRKYQTNREEVPLETVVKFPKEMDPAQLTGFGQPHAKAIEEEEPQLTQMEDSQRYVPTSPQQVNQPHLQVASNPVCITLPKQELVEGSTWPLPHQSCDPSNPTLYMPLNPVSLEGESMYMAPGETPESKKLTSPDEVEEVYDTPLLDDDDENDDTYDVVSDSGQNRKESVVEEDHYYI